MKKQCMQIFSMVSIDFHQKIPNAGSLVQDVHVVRDPAIFKTGTSWMGSIIDDKFKVIWAIMKIDL